MVKKRLLPTVITKLILSPFINVRHASPNGHEFDFLFFVFFFLMFISNFTFLLKGVGQC